MKLKGIIALFILILSGNTFAASPIAATQGMVVSEQALASEIGVKILRAGGNAIDAAIAVGYALAVVNPCCGNLGGGGFITLHLADGKDVFLNFRETAPLAAKPNMFLDTHGNVLPNKSIIGYLAVATPGTVMGFEHALEKYGTMSRQQVIAPAIELAEKGFVLTPGDIELLHANTDQFKQQTNVAAIFLNHGHPYQAGDRLVQKELAQTLRQISYQGAKLFYHGRIAMNIVRASQAHHGILTLNDFAKYRVVEMAPVQCTYRGYKIISAPPPSSGGTALCEMLNILEKYPLPKLGYLSAPSVHYIVEAMRFAFADRNTELGDPDFVRNPVEKLLSKAYAEQLRQHISATKAGDSSQQAGQVEGMHTTHYSVIDKWGNSVSLTYTLNSLFGAQVIADHTGFFLNNEMDDFTSKANKKNQFGLVQGMKNDIQPGKRPLSSMSPTIIMKNNKVVMMVGSPGGPRIITATLLTILNVIDYGMNIQEAVNAARFHFQGQPNLLYIEPHALSHNTIKQLHAMGYQIQLQPAWGAVEAIYVDPVKKIIYGANDDKRRPAGKAVGYSAVRGIQ